MRKIVTAVAAVTLAALVGMTTGCEWSSGSSGDSFSSAGITINFTGTYSGQYGGGRAVENSSGGAITRFVITQAGNALTVYDSNGSVYNGSIGTPNGAQTVAGVYPAGSEIVQSQVSFSGTDNTSGRLVDVVGIIHAVAVTDVVGSTGSSSQTSTSTTTTSDGVTITETIQVLDGGGNVIKTTVINKSAITGETLSITETVTDTTQFQITEANTQYRLTGNWVEQGGAVSGVNALSPATSGVIFNPGGGGGGPTP